MPKISSQEEIVTRFELIHKKLYDYNLVEYKGLYKKVKIVCPTHGIFEQTPYKHLKNQGCPKSLII